MRKFISVTAILLALTCSAHAGDMPNGSPVPPPPQPATVVEAPTTVETAEDGTLQGGVMQAALDLLALLPSLF